MNSSLLMQIVMVVVAVVIGLLYIEPTIAQIKQNQDATYAYQIEMKKVSDVNAALAAQVVVLDSLSLDKTQALESYFPDTIDEIVVIRDIVAILASVQSEPMTLSYVEAQSNINSGTSDQSSDELIDGEEPATVIPVVNSTVTHVFDLSVNVTYTQLKQFMDALAQNKYPLFVKDLTIVPEEGGFIRAKFTLETYSRFPTTSSFEEVSG
jgi:hypothetical protein